MNKNWHSGHFCCWQCDDSLTGQRYVLRDEHPYCGLRYFGSSGAIRRFSIGNWAVPEGEGADALSFERGRHQLVLCGRAKAREGPKREPMAWLAEQRRSPDSEPGSVQLQD
ncbi:four and a half LIM domains protein 2 isoform X3 [Tropilaelaps mercedesae]|uniref:Four and a half LIM domains protein 2 isoform X3 n=1 Tax=Tropilaelaps mercedesae TaxID=418985 RepID=A0A1V9XG13_9ACAR|nr:four and a half LIM domains protein 2 isoform X3 [Tropilaelaps mercedesae]